MSEETPATDWIIELDNVNVASMENPQLSVIVEVQWQIRAGDYWVVGAWPRSGKSDLLATAAGFMRPLQGTVRLFGRDASRLVANDLLRERLRIGMVFAEGARPFHNMTVQDNVALALCYHKNAAFDAVGSEVSAVLDLLELTPLAYQQAGRLNRSWQKRTGLGRALIFKPEILFLDNPLAGLELRHVGWWIDFLAHLSAGHPFFQGRPVTLVVAAEDLRPWMKQAKQFAVIKESHLVRLGGPADLTRSNEPMVRELLADTPPSH